MLAQKESEKSEIGFVKNLVARVTILVDVSIEELNVQRLGPSSKVLVIEFSEKYLDVGSILTRTKYFTLREII